LKTLLISIFSAEVLGSCSQLALSTDGLFAANMDPIFTAVSNNANQLYTLLRCIGFADKAAVSITPDGLRFSVEESRVMQGMVVLDKALFTTYSFNPPAENNNTNDNGNWNGVVDDDDDEEAEGATNPQFLISLSALLETLQIFGISDTTMGPHNNTFAAPSPTASNAFTNPALLLGRSCKLRYSHAGSALSITLSESGVTTTCELTTYEADDPSFGSAAGELNIPLQRDAIIMKIIMRSAWLHNAVTELDSTNPTVLTISASAKRAPFFALSGSGGPFSESSIEFSIAKNAEDGNALSHAQYKVIGGEENARAQTKRSRMAPTVTETFMVSPPSSMGARVRENYRFSLIRKATRAMALANKVCIRGDIQGVLSLQFLIESGESANPGPTPPGAYGPPGSSGGVVSFVDFRFVPLMDEEDGDGETGNDEMDEDEL
jgi:cell cycle checkpoint protein